MQADPSEQWIWLGIKKAGWGTYAELPYDKWSIIYPNYEQINDLDTLHLHIKGSWLPGFFNSPTGCYFEIDGEEFYHDQQGCLCWSLEKCSGKVYLAVPSVGDDVSARIYVAASLPEFLSHMHHDNYTWHQGKPSYYGNTVMNFVYYTLYDRYI